MFRKQIDILTIGDITTDAFIRLKNAHIHSEVDLDGKKICIPFGEKIPFEYVKIIKAVGNAANAAFAGKKLGLNTAIITNIGNDENGKDCLAELQNQGIITSFVTIQKNKNTNYHFVLWYEVDRTILVNHIDYDYSLPNDFIYKKNIIGNKSNIPKWIYLTSLAANTSFYHMQIADYLDSNPSVKLAFQPGTYQIKAGINELKRIYDRTDFFIVNLEEAKELLQIQTANIRTQTSAQSPTEPPIQSKYESSIQIKSLLKSIANLGPKLVVITDDVKGAYMFDGDHYYHMPIYPDPKTPFERTGCGDAWAATFVSALAMGKTPLEALMWAPINPMSVAQFIGSKEGLLALDQLEWWLSRAPDDYKPREI